LMEVSVLLVTLVRLADPESLEMMDPLAPVDQLAPQDHLELMDSRELLANLEMTVKSVCKVQEEYLAYLDHQEDWVQLV